MNYSQKALFLPALAIFCFLRAFISCCPSLPLYLIDTFHSSKSEVGLILSCYTVAALAVRPFSGFLADKFDRKPVYLLAYAFFIAIFISYPLVEVIVLIFALMRVLHGLAFGMVTTAGNTHSLWTLCLLPGVEKVWDISGLPTTWQWRLDLWSG